MTIGKPIIHRPAILLHIVLKSHRAQIISLCLAVFLIFIAPPVVSFTTHKIFPPKSSKKLFGLVNKKTDRPIKLIADKVLIGGLWIASGGAVFLLFLISVPARLAEVAVYRKKLILEAETILEINPSKSLALYRRALLFAIEPESIDEIKAKIQNILPHLSPSESSNATIMAGQSGLLKVPTVHDGSDRIAPTNSDYSLIDTSGRYMIVRPLGKGAMGIVYCARDTVLDRKVALKQLSMRLTGDEEYTLRFRQEAKALAQLTHPNIVQVYDFLEDNDRLWMVLEYVDGGDLATFCRTNQKPHLGTMVDIVVKVARGLAYAHDRGIIHRDLKPANILLTNDRIPKISDFGIAKLSQSSSMTQTGTVLGSPLYMSPEQASGATVDGRCDIYALGITLYELITGHVPFEGDTSSVLARQIVEAPIPPSEKVAGIPKELENIILQMLDKDPRNRPQDMHTVADILKTFADLELPVS